jgi:hypothetical protein
MVSHPPLGPAMERPAHSATKSVGSSWSVRSGSDRDEGSTTVVFWRQGLSTTTLGRAAKCRPSAGPCKRHALSPFSASSNVPVDSALGLAAVYHRTMIARHSHSVRTIDQPHSIVSPCRNLCETSRLIGVGKKPSEWHVVISCRPAAYTRRGGGTACLHDGSVTYLGALTGLHRRWCARPAHDPHNNCVNPSPDAKPGKKRRSNRKARVRRQSSATTAVVSAAHPP